MRKSTWSEMVCQFNEEVLKIEPRQFNNLSIDEFNMSKTCLLEEVDEFVEAYKNEDFIAQLDSLIDLIYFAVGIMYKMGLGPSQIDGSFEAVHLANLQKKLGVNSKREFGVADAVKPSGWVPPEQRIREILEK